MTGRNLLSWAVTWTVEAEKGDVTDQIAGWRGEESRQHHQVLFSSFVFTALAFWFILYRRLLTDAL